MGIVVQLNEVVLNFPALFTAKTSQMYPNNPPQFSASFLVQPNHPGLQELYQKIQEVGAANSAVNYPEIKPPKDDNTGILSVRAASQADAPPDVYDAGNNPVTPLMQGEFYSGAIVNVAVDVYYSKNNRRVCIGLLAVQKVRDGDRIDNRPDTKTLFKPINVNSGNPNQQQGGQQFGQQQQQQGGQQFGQQQQQYPPNNNTNNGNNGFMA